MMSILERLGISDRKVKLQGARRAVEQAKTLLDTKGVMVLQTDRLNGLRSTMGECTLALNVAAESASVKQDAISKAVDAVKMVEAAVQAADGMKGAMIENFHAEYAKTISTILTPLRNTAAAAAPGAEFSPPVKGEMEDNARRFNIAIRGAGTATEARKAFDNALIEHDRLKAIARTIKPAEAEASGLNQVAAAKLFKQLQQDVLAMEMANAPGAADLSKRLYATVALTSSGDHAGAFQALQALERGLGKAAENNRKAAEQALDGPRVEARSARARMDRLAANPAQKKLDLVQSVLPTIAGKLDTLDMFLDGNLTPKSAVAANAMLKEIGDLLTEAEGLTPQKDKDSRATLNKIKETLAPKSFVIFKGKGAEAEALFPKEYAALVAKKDKLAGEIDGLGAGAAGKIVQDLVTEAEALVNKAATQRSELEQWKKRLPMFESAIKGMNAVVKGDTATQGDPELRSRIATGPFIEKTNQLKLGLGLASPDGAALKALVEELEKLLVTFNPMAADYGKMVLDAHKDSRKQAAAFAKNKQDAEPRCQEADKMLKEAKDAVGQANPADGLALKQAVSEIAASKKQVRAATEPRGLEAALQRLATATKSAKQLKDHPGGDAPHSRSKLGEIDQRWTSAVTEIRNGLGTVKQEVTAADNLESQGKAEIGVLIDAAIARFDGAAFTAIIKAMTDKPTNENAAERMKACEQGLRLVRQFRDAISGDPVITSLVVSKAFTISAFTLANQALEDLNFNLSRAI